MDASLFKGTKQFWPIWSKSSHFRKTTENASLFFNNNVISLEGRDERNPSTHEYTREPLLRIKRKITAQKICDARTKQNIMSHYPCIEGVEEYLSGLPPKGPYLQKSIHSTLSRYTIGAKLHTKKRLSFPSCPPLFTNNFLTHLGITHSTSNPSNCKQEKSLTTSQWRRWSIDSPFLLHKQHNSPQHNASSGCPKSKYFPRNKLSRKKGSRGGLHLPNALPLKMNILDIQLFY